jgi:transcriptional regulator with XRE-family HTH domain
MQIDLFTSDTMILQELGSRVARLRLQRNLTQTELAVQAGVSKRTVERFEKGEVGIQLPALVKLLRVLGLVDRFEMLVPKSLPSPIEMLKREGKQRKRASKETVKPKPGSWTWSDEP